MGNRVRRPNSQAPVRSYEDRCPTCGGPRWVVNGPWLRWLRERAGLDQRALAAKLDMSGAYLSDIERNRRECPEFVLKAYRGLKKHA